MPSKRNKRIQMRTTSSGQQTPQTTSVANQNTTSSESQTNPTDPMVNQQNTRPKEPMQRFDFDSGDETEPQLQATQQPMQSARPTGKLMDSFSGLDPNIKVDDWLITFEVVTRRFTDEERQTALFRHVTGDALTFAARELAPKLDNLSWADIRNQFQARFGRPKHSHLLEAIDRQLKPNETIVSYFNEKRRLMILANQDDKNQVDLLTRGLNNERMESHIAAQQPKTTQQWLSIALAIESVRKTHTENEAQSHHNETHSHHNTSDHKNWNQKPNSRPFPRPDFSKPATTPCPFCKFVGFKEIHWKRDCPRFKQIANPELVDRVTRAETTNRNENQTEPKSLSDTTPTHGMKHLAPLDFIRFDVLINGKPIRPFLDSGSTVTAISRSAASRLNLKWDEEKAIPLRQVDGLTQSLGTVDATLQINGDTFKIPVHVLENLEHDMLLGLDSAHSAGLVIDFGRQVKEKTLALHSLCSTTHSNHSLNDRVQKNNKTATHSITKQNSRLKPKNDSKSKQQLKNKRKTVENKALKRLNASIVDAIRGTQHEIDAYSVRYPTVIEGLIHIQFHGIFRLVVPHSLVGSILEEFVGKRNHSDIQKTIRDISRRFWWPHMFSDIKQHVRDCHVCHKQKQQQTANTPNRDGIQSKRSTETDSNADSRTLRSRPQISTVESTEPLNPNSRRDAMAKQHLKPSIGTQTFVETEHQSMTDSTAFPIQNDFSALSPPFKELKSTPGKTGGGN